MKDSFLLQLGEGKQGPELSFEEYERTERGKANRSLAVQISRENDRLKGLLERSGKQGDRGRGKGVPGNVAGSKRTARAAISCFPEDFRPLDVDWLFRLFPAL